MVICFTNKDYVQELKGESCLTFVHNFLIPQSLDMSQLSDNCQVIIFTCFLLHRAYPLGC